MKLIAGLGNPGAEYIRSRHNVGFDVLDILAERWSISYKKRKFNGRCGAGLVGFENVTLLKPLTFMNRSGLSIAEAVNFYKVPYEDILIVADDMSLPLGQIRLRAKGSAGGHNGLKDIIQALGSNEFARLKVGIGGAKHNNAVGHVLGLFTDEERQMLQPALIRSVKAIESWMNDGVSVAMNSFNSVVETKSDQDREEK
ncbi:MAG: aminoacyl-tRNA hydrolase [Phycisphaerae bacterium]|nr:aminoacyl-tRNA hydrolase [Phycisphaerae bacterium]